MSDLRSIYPFDQAHEGYFISSADGSVDENSDDPVYVAVCMDVCGFGPHWGSMAVDQNRYHASEDTVLQAAYEIEEDHLREHHGDHLVELEAEKLAEHIAEYLVVHPDATREDAEEETRDAAYTEADEQFRCNLTAVTWKVTAQEFIRVVQAWPHQDSRDAILEGVGITLKEADETEPS
jgi:hypothetical protein